MLDQPELRDLIEDAVDDDREVGRLLADRRGSHETVDNDEVGARVPEHAEVTGFQSSDHATC